MYGDDTFWSSGFLIRLEELKKRESISVRNSGCRKQLPQVFGLLGKPARVEGQEHGVEHCRIDSGFLPAGIEVVWNLFACDKAPIDIDCLTPRTLEVL